ncbi:MAG: Holliday junction resolvase RuvX [Lentimicrobiaceae bacterium]|nr:Holliday junction resolvase RuvX [Lentimicrobiaceae bacterium]
MARILAMDFGRKRTGIAVTDEFQLIASGLATVPSHEVIAFLTSYMRKENVERFIVGEPRQMNNLPSESVKFIEPFIHSLKKAFPAIPVERMDERFTSRLAFRTMTEAGLKRKDRQNKALIDKVSAVIILQSYLESRMHTKPNLSE